MTTAQSNRIAKLLLAAGLLLILLWAGLKGWRVARALRSLQARQAEVEPLLEGQITEADPDRLEALVLDTRRDVVILRDELGFLVPLGPAFGWLPRVGPLLAEAPALLAMADAGTEGAAYLLRGLKPALYLFQQGDEGLIPRLLPILEEARPELVAADRALRRLVVARGQITDVEALPWRVRTLLAQMDEHLALVEMVPLLHVAPELLGADGPRRYLLLAQNEDEIRPTGGFLTGAGLLTVTNGDLGAVEFVDGNFVDAWDGRVLTKPYNPPPEPLSQLMGLGLFLFRDANFWPDFPSSAEQALALYRYGQGAPPVDGIIALDQKFLAMLLGASGPPLSVPELGITVSSSNVIDQIHNAWEEPAAVDDGKPWVLARKDFLGPLANALKDRLLTDFSQIDPLFFAKTMQQALAEKHLQIYLRDPQLAPLLDRLDWDGRLEYARPGDHLLPVDTNVGYNKVGPAIETSVTYEVTLAADGTAEATTTLVYTHTGDTPVSCRQGRVFEQYSAETAYASLREDCFWNYVRLYLPAGSTLLDGSAHPAGDGAFSYSEGWSGGPAVSEAESGDFTVLANFFLLAPGETLTSVFRYRLPQVVQEQEGTNLYRLVLPRQAGANPRAATVQVTLPEGARLQSTRPAPLSHTGQTFTFKQLVETDFELTIVYE